MATKLIRNEKENRFELQIDGRLIGFTTGQDEADHLAGAKTLKGMAEDKGHTVHLDGVILDGE